MSREVHVRFWERPGVKVLRATRHKPTFPCSWVMSAVPPTADIRAAEIDVRFVPCVDIG